MLWFLWLIIGWIFFWDLKWVSTVEPVANKQPPAAILILSKTPINSFALVLRNFATSSVVHLHSTALPHLKSLWPLLTQTLNTVPFQNSDFRWFNLCCEVNDRPTIIIHTITKQSLTLLFLVTQKVMLKWGGEPIFHNNQKNHRSDNFQFAPFSSIVVPSFRMSHLSSQR